MIVQRRIHLKVIGIILAVILVGIWSTYYFLQNRSPVSIPQAVIDKTLFPVYVPAPLPAGFTIDEASATNNDGVLVFDVKNRDGRVISVSEQSMPANFDFTAFYEKQMKGARTISGAPFHSVIGEMVVENGQGAKFLSVRADGTWIMVTGKDVLDDELELIARQLKRA
jgi:hypothetical protein